MFRDVPECSMFLVLSTALRQHGLLYRYCRIRSCCLGLHLDIFLNAVVSSRRSTCWNKSSSRSASLFNWHLAAAWRGRFFPVWQKVFHTFETGNTAYFVLWSYRSKTSWVVLCWNIPASTQNIINNQWPHILLNWFPTVECSSVLIHLFCPRKGNMSRAQTEALRMVTQVSPKFNFRHFSHNYHNYSMFRDVPECSGMFRDVPCSWFYRRPYLSLSH